MFLTFTNVGSLGTDNFEDLKPENLVVRQQLYDTLSAISNEGDPPDVLCVQECRTFRFEPLPFFKLPVSTSEHVTHGKDDGGTRGVCIYSNKFTEKLDLEDEYHEICALKFEYKSSNGASEKLRF